MFLFFNISLSSNMAEHVDDLAEDIKCSLEGKCKYFVAFSVAIYDSRVVMCCSVCCPYHHHICRGVGPIIDPLRSLFKGLP
jgi:hypothetical protein